MGKIRNPRGQGNEGINFAKILVTIRTGKENPETRDVQNEERRSLGNIRQGSGRV